MKKYAVLDDDMHHSKPAGALGEWSDVYLASEVDAEVAARAERDARYMDELDKRDARIAELENAKVGLTNVIESRGKRIYELENALRAVRAEIQMHSGLRNEYQDWSDAFDTINRVLTS
jgi:hypothetical protein